MKLKIVWGTIGVGLLTLALVGSSSGCGGSNHHGGFIASTSSSTLPLLLTLTAVSPQSGPVTGGTTITLTGTGFISGMEVLVADLPATNVIVASPTSATAVTPAGFQGAADVAVITQTAAFAIPGAFVYLTLPQAYSIEPNALPVTNPNLLISTGVPFVIAGAGFEPGLTTVTFGSAQATSIVVQSPNALTGIIPAQSAPGPVTVTVTVEGVSGTLATPFVYGQQPSPDLPSAAFSVVAATVAPVTTILSNGIATATIEVVAVDQFGLPMANQSVTLSATGSLNNIGQPPPTNSSGVTFGTIATTVSGTRTISANISGVAIAAKAQVTFGALGRFGVVANSDNGLTVYGSNATTGQLRPLSYGLATSERTSNSADTLGQVVVHPNNQFVYAANLTESNVFGFQLSSQGVLLPLQDSPFGGAAVPTMTSPSVMAVDPLGRFLYVADSTDNVVNVFVVSQSTGALTFSGAVSVFGTAGSITSPTNTGASGAVGSMAIDPTGRFLYAVIWDKGNVVAFAPSVVPFAINSSNGLLIPNGPALPSGGPSIAPGYVVCDPLARFIVTTDEANRQIYLYATDSGGHLTELFWESTTGNNPEQPGIDVAGNFVLVPEESSDEVELFKVDLVNKVLVSEGLTNTHTVAPQRVDVEPSGRFANVTASGGFATYALSGTGVPQANPTFVSLAVAGSGFGYSTGTTPLTFVPETLYVTNQNPSTPGTANVQAFTITASTGALALDGAAVSGLTTPTSIALEPQGRYAYVADAGTSTIDSYTISATTGQLTFGGPFTEVGVNAVTADQTGNFLIASGSSFALDLLEISPGAGVALARPIPNAEQVAATTSAALSFFGATGPTLVTDNVTTGAEAIRPFAIQEYFSGTGSTAGTNYTSTNPPQFGGIAVHPMLGFVYFLDISDSLIDADQILGGPSTISLQSGSGPPTDGLPTGQGPNAIAMDPLGQLVFVANTAAGSGSISVYTVDTGLGDVNLGQLTAVTASPFSFSAATGPSAMTVDPSGAFLYVAGTQASAGEILIFTINRGSPLSATTLTAAGSIASGGTSPSALAIRFAVQ